MFPELDPLLHSQLRLAVMSLLLNLEEAEFVYLKKQTGVSSGNLSLQLEKLRAAGYITISKGFKNKYPVTVCKITPPGVRAFEKYVEVISEYLKISPDQAMEGNQTKNP
jgi:DNA-binding MarR family transcriptional regulator